ncbi:50S ribosomal protein L10 [bacterium]|nr:50S ribosomal protein L10 [bacterium]
MNRQQKETFVQKLNQQFSGAQAAFVVNYQGLTVAQIQTLRFALYDKGAKFQVAKNRLSKIALPSMAGADALVPHLKGQLALVFAKDDVTGVAKIINDFARENEQLKIVAKKSSKHSIKRSSLGAIVWRVERSNYAVCSGY